jgi:hypothetical protein
MPAEIVRAFRPGGGVIAQLTAEPSAKFENKATGNE